MCYWTHQVHRIGRSIALRHFIWIAYLLVFGVFSGGLAWVQFIRDDSAYKICFVLFRGSFNCWLVFLFLEHCRHHDWTEMLLWQISLVWFMLRRGISSPDGANILQICSGPLNFWEIKSHGGELRNGLRRHVTSLGIVLFAKVWPTHHTSKSSMGSNEKWNISRNGVIRAFQMWWWWLQNVRKRRIRGYYIRKCTRNAFWINCGDLHLLYGNCPSTQLTRASNRCSDRNLKAIRLPGYSIERSSFEFLPSVVLIQEFAFFSAHSAP